MTMKKTSYLFFVIFLSILISCKKDKKEPEETTEQTQIPSTPGTKTISGKVQKGPYKNGSPIIVYELNNSLGQTGKSFATTIIDDEGKFSLNNISLASNYVLLTATGYYYNEHFNRTSEGQLYLEALADVSNISTVNINVLTHIIKPRIELLVNNGMDFNTARSQVQNELLSVLGISSSLNTNFESMFLSNSDFLFAASLLFQRNNSSGYIMGYNYTSELSTLLSNFRNDFANNGSIDNQSIIDTLLYNATRVDLIDAKIDMQNYYSSLGLVFSTTNFEQYIYAFQKKYSPNLSSTISFPDSAPIMVDAPGVQPPYTYVTNIVRLNQSVYTANAGGGNFSISAIVPYDSSLVIKITPYNATFPFSNFGGGLFGWRLSQSGGTFIYTAQRKNIQLSAFIQNPAIDSCKVEYFNNLTSTTPYLTRNIVFN